MKSETVEELEQQAVVEAALEADREKALRDVFATAAMQSEIASLEEAGIPDNAYMRENIARSAYRMADAMMKVRREVYP